MGSPRITTNGGQTVTYKNQEDPRMSWDRQFDNAPRPLDPNQFRANLTNNMPGFEKQLQGAQYNLNSSAIDQQRKEAMRAPGQASPWLGMQRQLNANAASRQMDQGRAGAWSGAATGANALASRGGLTSGAAERMAQNASKQAMFAGQGAMAGQNDANLTAGMADEKNRMGQLQNASALDTTIAGQRAGAGLGVANAWGQMADQGNRNKLANQSMMNDARMSAYDNQMKGYAAKKASDAADYAADKAEANKGFFGNLFS